VYQITIQAFAREKEVMAILKDAEVVIRRHNQRKSTAACPASLQELDLPAVVPMWAQQAVLLEHAATVNVWQGSRPADGSVDFNLFVGEVSECAAVLIHSRLADASVVELCEDGAILEHVVDLF
jgi:hypothetical protein